MENTEEGMPLEELMDVEWLSIRSYNVCKEADLIFLNRILNFYQKHGTFLGYKNCGVKSNRELIEMCIKYLGNSNNQQIQKEDNLRFTLNSFTPYQKSIIIRHFDYLISKLNVRSYKGLMSLSDSNNQHILYEKFLLEDFNFKRLSNIGYKSIQELETIKNELISFIYFIKTLKINELSKEYTKLIVRSNFSNLPKDYEKQFDNFFDENGKIKLFQLLSYVINFGNLFSEVNNKIFEITYSNNEKHKNQESIAKELNLSRERVRQIKLKFEEEIENYFLFISNLKMDDLVNYNIDGVNSVIAIDNFFSEDINNTEGVNFNIKFYVKIFGILLRNTHTILNDYILIDGKRKSQIPHKSCYLINKVFYNFFDFENFTLDIYLKQNERISETYFINFSGFIYNFLKDGGKSHFSEIYDVCQAIIYKEFEFVLDADGYITFERNTTKQLNMYCYDILNEFSEPMNLEDIETVLNQRYPYLNKSLDAIRACLIKEKDTFISFGRTSTYGLKKWEYEKENLKGGTIRDIVEVLLESSNSPLHISDITEHVSKFRTDTYSRSIIDNLKADVKSVFVFYPGSFIGLKVKNYDESTLKFKKLSGSRFTQKTLKKYQNWNFEKLINHYCILYGYSKAQVVFAFNQRIKEGTISLTENNTLII